VEVKFTNALRKVSFVPDLYNCLRGLLPLAEQKYEFAVTVTLGPDVEYGNFQRIGTCDIVHGVFLAICVSEGLIPESIQDKENLSEGSEFDVLRFGRPRYTVALVSY
jgi:hypothetical protein